METSNSRLIPSFHNYKCDKDTEISEKLCADLNLNEFFSAIDFTSSSIGRQYLYHLLHQDRQSEIEKHESLINKISRDKEYRTRLTKTLAQTNSPDAYYITSLFTASMTVPSKYRLWGMSLSRFAPFILAGLVFVTHSTALLQLLTVSFIINFVLHYRNKKNIYQYYYSIPQSLRMLKQAEELMKDPSVSRIDASIGPAIEDLKSLKDKLRFFRLSIRMDSDIAILVYCIAEVFNIFFLTEVYAINQSLLGLTRKKESIEKIFCFVGLVDTLCSVSLLREQLPYYCLPDVPADKRTLQVKAVYHPLIKDAVANDLTLAGKSMLITGSNMSGKTCFIRTIGINLLSAKVLNTCFARIFTMNLATRIFSSIRNEDSLQEGRSYFLQETIQIKEMIDQSAKAPCLFLLDEPFKGTNTQERIAICGAVLAALAENGNVVLATTHDIELNNLLRSCYLPYYFCETVRKEQLYFDYQLKQGVATQHNAIRILEICHYPEAVVQKANELASSPAVFTCH